MLITLTLNSLCIDDCHILSLESPGCLDSVGYTLNANQIWIKKNTPTQASNIVGIGLTIMLANFACVVYLQSSKRSIGTIVCGSRKRLRRLPARFLLYCPPIVLMSCVRVWSQICELRLSSERWVLDEALPSSKHKAGKCISNRVVSCCALIAGILFSLLLIAFGR